MVDVVILAGGKSSRFKKNKMETLLSGKPILQHTIESFTNLSNNITVVTGFYEVDYLKEFIEKHHINVIHNALHEKGMFGSVLKGVSLVKGDFLLTPGDYPNISQETIKILINAKGSIRVPTYKGRKGHPIFIGKSLLESLKNEDIHSNLKVFRDKHVVNYIEVDDEGILQDVDYLEDLKNIEERLS